MGVCKLGELGDMGELGVCKLEELGDMVHPVYSRRRRPGSAQTA